MPGLLIPIGLKKREQLGYVLRTLNLQPLEPRCMACGGELAEVSKESVRDRAPPRTFAWLDRFYECQRCGQLMWEGTHWEKVTEELRMITTATAATVPTGNQIGR